MGTGTALWEGETSRRHHTEALSTLLDIKWAHPGAQGRHLLRVVQEVAHILAHATPRSLVLVDELGRATSTADGVALAWAVGEQLVSRGAPTLFATHFHPLTDLAVVYPAATAWHFGVDASRHRLDFSWRLRAGGSEEAGHYGLLLARAVGFPPEVLQVAEEVVAGGLAFYGAGGGTGGEPEPRRGAGRRHRSCGIPVVHASKVVALPTRLLPSPPQPWMRARGSASEPTAPPTPPSWLLCMMWCTSWRWWRRALRQGAARMCGACRSSCAASSRRPGRRWPIHRACWRCELQAPPAHPAVSPIII